MRNRLKESVFSIRNRNDFEKLSLEVFHFQAEHNLMYRKYLQLLKKDHHAIKLISEIPFLPIEFFKTEQVLSVQNPIEKVFRSSTTTGAIPSSHYIPDINVYQRSYLTAFRMFYGAPEEYCLLALLPSYLERDDSSLVFMMDGLIKISGHQLGGFFSGNYSELSSRLHELKSRGDKTILTGVTFALLDFSESYPVHFPDLIVMETGGMKGKRKEMVRDDVHTVLKNNFGIAKVHSEYGMTELMSQAYSKGNGIFNCPPWMAVFIRETNDPFSYCSTGKTGGINIIDLANIDTCAFIETQDLGKSNPDGSFEVLGRFDNSEVRGCNLMLND